MQKSGYVTLVEPMVSSLMLNIGVLLPSRVALASFVLNFSLQIDKLNKIFMVGNRKNKT